MPDAEWTEITGYKFRYRINTHGTVQKQLDNGQWYTMTAYLGGKTRACVKMWTADNRKLDVPLVWLMADAYMGGRIEGTAIIHKNGSKLDCDLFNLLRIPMDDCGKYARHTTKTVMKIDRKGNVVAIYKSVGEAAKKNFISKGAIKARCRREVADPYRLDGHDYRYEEEERRGRKKQVQAS